MFKTIITLFRGATHDAEEHFKDANAQMLLQQHLRDASRQVTAARRAVAVAVAQNRQEQTQYQKLVDRLADLEARTIEALDQGKSDLAKEAAQTIAYMEAERDTSAAAQSLFDSEIAGLKHNVQVAEGKLRELQQGMRLASAKHETQRLRRQATDTDLSSLKAAEATLNRLQKRQIEIELTDQALAELDATGNSQAITGKLAAAGCGKPQTGSAEDVLARLKNKSRKQTKSQKPAA